MKKSYLIFGGSAVLLLIVATLVVYSRSGQPISPALDLSPTPAIPSAEVPKTGAVRDFVFAASNFEYSLTELRAKKGDLVKIVLQNQEGFHDLKIDEFGVATEKLQAGQEDMIEFVADKTGTFEYYCSVGSHRQMGMKGNLIVE